MLFFMPYFFAKYFDAADKLKPALVNSLRSFLKSDLLISSFLSFLMPFITIVISPITSLC